MSLGKAVELVALVALVTSLFYYLERIHDSLKGMRQDLDGVRKLLENERAARELRADARTEEMFQAAMLEFGGPGVADALSNQRADLESIPITTPSPNLPGRQDQLPGGKQGPPPFPYPQHLIDNPPPPTPEDILKGRRFIANIEYARKLRAQQKRSQE